MIDLSRLKPRLEVSGRVQVSGVPHGMDAMILPEVAKTIGSRAIVHVALDDQRAAVLADQLDGASLRVTKRVSMPLPCMCCSSCSPNRSVDSCVR